GPFDVVVEEVADVQPAPGEALLRIERVGVCGSDVSFFKGTHPYRHYPRIQGHEAAGRVVALGEGDRGGLAVGDLVAVEPLIACGACYPCRIGRANCCTDLKVLGAHLDGAFREFVALPFSMLYPANDLDPDLVALCEPISIAVQAAARGEIGPGDRVVVMGAGPIGAGICLAATDRGARVLCTDLLPSRLELARLYGAERTVVAGAEDVAAVVAEWTGGEGPTVTVDAVGAPPVIRQCCALVANAGRVVIVGLSEQEVSLPIIDFTRKEMTIVGSRNNAGRFGDAVSLVRRNRDRVGAMITHRYPLQRTAEALRFSTEHPAETEKVMIEVA
ncbi:MAG: alcohol dehydrogenase catalytic domain-containing protein, partial [Chloroflexia bacterium]|nr:alcohol dehydrogenase catalytic domain-containing protein [Chloroflexia bacterium]